MKILFDQDTINMMNMFGIIAKVQPKDCIIEKERVIFLVNPGEIKTALGEKNKNLKNLEKRVNKKVRIIIFNPDLIQFVANLLFPLKDFDIQQEGKNIIISAEDRALKGKIYGPGRENLKFILDTVKRYFDVDEVVVK